MSEDFITFEQELLNTSREAIEFSKMYLEARKSRNCLKYVIDAIMQYITLIIDNLKIY